MKRRGLLLATIGMVLLTGWILHRAGWFSTSRSAATPARGGRVKKSEAFSTPSGWRYRQSRPHHWRYIMLRK